MKTKMKLVFGYFDNKYFQNFLFPEEFLECMGYISNYLTKINSVMELVFGAHFLHIFPKKHFFI